VDELLAGLKNFYDPKVGSVVRWLPAVQDELKGEEPQKKPRVMDSWYLYHPLLNLSRLAERGYATARKLFFDSMDYAVKVAHHFNYQWPVFYDIDTLEVVRAETTPGEGGEKDVAGFYAHVMLQAWGLSKEQRYLDEAVAAMKSLKGLGFKLAYQMNNTIFTAGAAYRLWKETGEAYFRDLSEVCFANIMNNVWLWEMDYGYGRHYPTIFGMFPLKDAPYPAAYEEIEAVAAIHDHVTRAKEDLPASLCVLLPEMAHYLLYKIYFYYPPALPREVFTEKRKGGEIDPHLWLPLEDIQDGWKQAGQVGQEIYGAGTPFGLAPRHYWHVDEAKLLFYCSYPAMNCEVEPNRITLEIIGDPRLQCELRIMPINGHPVPDARLQPERLFGREQPEAQHTPDGQIVWQVHAGQKVEIKW